ncbi:methionine--tRNA ligase [Candidatus Gracilibacteria bacterium]|nr:methionine--tRNA ligase [Candidatus Gracilibacteria bacterium]
MNKFYLSTAIAYVNAAPHVGHALEFVQADALTRYHRIKGDDVFFLTGTDEHGVKIFEAAQEKKMETKTFVDFNAKQFEDLKGILNLNYDGFVRTSSEHHKKGAQKIWMKMFEAGDIYKGVYKGNYCVGCESFIPEKDLDEEGNCPIHKKKPKTLEEENYFFKLSKYSDAIKKAIETDKLLILPEARKNEMLKLIGEDGLKDVSFSRPKDVLPWGVTVPNDDSQVMYVWCDALSNYITAIGYADGKNEEESDNFKKYWPCDVHLIGKDILRFHAGIWIGMLMSAGLDLPKAIYVHGFVTSEGQKMSKSLGNVINPLEYVEKYGTEAMRYYLLKEIPTADDGDFSHKRFLEIFNSELANSMGNLVNRVVMMTERYCGGKVPARMHGEKADFVGVDGAGVYEQLMLLVDAYKAAFERFDLKVACEALVSIVNLGNKYIDDKKPWTMAKETPEKVPEVLYNLLELLRFVGILFYPILPECSVKILKQIGANSEDIKIDSLKWGVLKEGSVVEKAEVLFPRIEE